MNKRRILFIDDEPNVLTTVGDFLRFKGFDVKGVERAEAGLETLDHWKPDLIILDISMPGMGGLGFLKQLWESGGRQKTPVLVLTARTNMQDFFSGLDIAGFLPKSCSREELVMKIDSILAASEAHRHVSSAAPSPRRVLVGEDDIEQAEAIRKAMESSGMVVEILSSGNAVIDRMIESPPHVIVLKEQLAGLKGSLVAQLVARMPAIHSVPVIVHDISLAIGSAGEPAPRRAAEGVTEWVSSSEPEFLARAAKRVLAPR